jgi:LPPG:FO 2-phospho-L-lactate transferase
VLTALAGGVGAARLMIGMVQVADPSDITVVVNTGDDMVLHGLAISPDIDTVTYTLAGKDNRETGWGVADETFTTMTELEELGGQAWFRLGDRDLATHLYRTQRMAEGATLSDATAELAQRRGLAVRILPMSDHPVRTMVTLAGEDEPEVGFQHYFVRLRHSVPVRAVRFDGAAVATPAPGVLDAIARAERIVVCPSNPLVSIGPILAVPGVRDALVVELGHQSSVVGVARLYADWVGTLVIDHADADLADAVRAEGLRCVTASTVMSDPGRSADLARTVLDARG